MNMIASVPISKSEVLPDTEELEQEYDSLKLISQEIIEQKEAIIEQIYKQLKDSIRTIDVLTTQLQTCKQNQPQQIYISQLQEKGFLRKENDHYFIIADVTKVIESNRQSIKIDTDLQIINETFSDKIQTKFKALQSGYSRAMEQCDLFLKALSQKQEKEQILKKEIQSLKKAEAELKDQSSRLKEQLEMVTIQYQQHKQQQGNEKNSLVAQRKQLCLELSQLKKLANKNNQRALLIQHQNKELKKTISLLEERIKGYELQKMQREYYQSDLIRSYKQSIKYVDYESQCPERQEYVFDKENKINLGNIEAKGPKSYQNKDMLNIVRIDSITVDERGVKVTKKPFQVISPTESKQSSPSRQNDIDEHETNNCQNDTFPYANTIEKKGLKEEEQIKTNAVPHKQNPRTKKPRKVIRINY